MFTEQKIIEKVVPDFDQIIPKILCPRFGDSEQYSNSTEKGFVHRVLYFKKGKYNKRISMKEIKLYIISPPCVSARTHWRAEYKWLNGAQSTLCRHHNMRKPSPP
jgi:hypothetical protein